MTQVGMNSIQWATFAVVIVLVLFTSHLIRIDKNYKGLYVAYLLWFIHQAVFYIAYTVYPSYLQGWFTEWSAGIRLHGYLLVLTTLVYRWYRNGIKSK